MGNPFLERMAKMSGSAHGGRSEARVASKTGARLHPSSGAMQGAKSDASLGQYRMESKSTTSHRLSIERAWLEKITQEAMPNGQVPALTISFVTPEGKAVIPDWVAIPMWKWKELVGDGE